MQPRKISLIQLNVAVLMWGGTAMFAKGIALPVPHIICLRSLIGAAALVAMLAALRRPLKVGGGRHYVLMVTLGLLLCAHWLTYFKALKVSTAAVAILSLHTYPVITAIIEPFLFSERLRKSDVLLAVVVFIGIVIMTPAMSLSDATTRGIVLGVISGLFFMVRNLLTRKYVHQYTSSVLMFWQMLVTGLVLLPWLFIDRAAWTPATGGLLLLLGVVFTAVPHTLFSASFKHLSAKTVGIIATLLPFYAAFFGYLIHDETLSLRTIVGGSIILAAIAFETVRSVRM
ncbi:MAG: DMT family transporter [Sedimentisphaerales bacterium]|jgi:drug/metabolite transporter (DMT)-like permease|nr:DMT family transporter [Sedimentisphaerales bacterium]HNY79158.1 DMT family transporter [Sedimentisphaerales bacterium]HOC64200.1 DMT family transporter [Sedimentisphaerales bacterium]HOH65066.1 DMT family transporter [Sedimentisphaerales bacterium]HPY51174.1 DMT family transporter [Sedimentisphaerales bacterium]